MITLIKKNKKTVDLVFLEVDGTLIRKKEGKLDKPISFSSTSNCGSTEKVAEELKKMIFQYESKGYKIDKSGDIESLDFEVFDKAKWHFGNNFPKELAFYQAHVHTGFYIGWLIQKKLISEELSSQCSVAIDEFLNKKITSVTVYAEYLDGVFSSNDVNTLGYKFTKKYFDFENGNFLRDYEHALASDLPTLFHVKDNWENYDKIFSIIENRFNDFLNHI